MNDHAPERAKRFFNSKTQICKQNWNVFRPVDDALMESWHTPWTNFQIVRKQQNKREYSPIESNRALLLCNDFIWTWLVSRITHHSAGGGGTVVVTGSEVVTSSGSGSGGEVPKDGSPSSTRIEVASEPHSSTTSTQAWTANAAITLTEKTLAIAFLFFVVPWALSSRSGSWCRQKLKVSTSMEKKSFHLVCFRIRVSYYILLCISVTPQICWAEAALAPQWPMIGRDALALFTGRLRPQRSPAAVHGRYWHEQTYPLSRSSHHASCKCSSGRSSAHAHAMMFRS